MTNPPPPFTDAQIKSIAARVDRPIVLIGMMGVGKTSVGRKLAQLLSLPFADADEAIEEAAQMSVSEIFAKFGESYFRDGERRVIARLVTEPPRVIATGGGAFVQDDTRELVLEHGIPIWLDAEVATLVDRVRRKDTRPLLRGGDAAEILARLKAEREPYYAQAPIKVMSEPGPHGETLRRILEALDQWL